MGRIKLFESFNVMTEQEIRGAFVELNDLGYDVLVTKLGSELFNGYMVNISAYDDFFDIINVSEPILELIDYFKEKFNNSFIYSVQYIDVNTEEQMKIEDLEQFVKDNPLEDTWEVIITLRLK